MSSSSLQPLGSGPLYGDVSRRTGRTLARLDDQTEVAVARVRALAEVQGAKVDAIGAVTEHALLRTAFVSQVEQLLAQVVPLSTSRLQSVADAGTLGLVQTVASTADIVRRI